MQPFSTFFRREYPWMAKQTWQNNIIRSTRMAHDGFYKILRDIILLNFVQGTCNKVQANSTENVNQCTVAKPYFHILLQ